MDSSTRLSLAVNNLSYPKIPKILKTKTKKLTVAQISREISTARVPCALELEVFELRAKRPDFAVAPKYKKFRREYSSWSPDELISRLRILCVDSQKNALEILAIYFEFQSR